jgi:hypothetical protein
MERTTIRIARAGGPGRAAGGRLACATPGGTNGMTCSFETWHATFPATQARFVRLRVDARSFLHLTRVIVRRQ